MYTAQKRSLNVKAQLLQVSIMRTVWLSLLPSVAFVSLSGCNAQKPTGEGAKSINGTSPILGSGAKNETDCDERAVYRFDAVSPDGSDNRRIFIDFEKAFSGTVSKGSLATESHFGSPLRNCSTNLIRCVDAGQLVFGWPRDEARTTFRMGRSQCQLAQAEKSVVVSGLINDELAMRYHVVESAIEKVELLPPDYPKAIFESAGHPLPLCRL